MIQKPFVVGATATHAPTGNQIIIDGVDDTTASVNWHTVTRGPNGRDIITRGTSPIGDIVAKK